MVSNGATIGNDNSARTIRGPSIYRAHVLSPLQLQSSIAPFANNARVWFLDIWGVIHDGVRPFASAVAAAQRFRETGGHVILVSNSPRTTAGVVEQLDRIGVARSAYDAVVTSGDVTRGLIAAAAQPLFHLGPGRDLPLYAGLDVTLGEAAAARTISCTGLFDDTTETPDDYRELLAAFRAHDVPMICANPDVTVERGGRTIWCAGGIAQAYEASGGAVAYAGKPYPPIFAQACERASELAGAAVPLSHIIMIGDGITTDIAGAAAAGIGALLILGQTRAATMDSDALQAALGGLPQPIAVMAQLAW